MIPEYELSHFSLNQKAATSVQSNLTKASISAEHRSFCRIFARWRQCHVQPILSKTRFFVHASLSPERQLDRFSRFCTAYWRDQSHLSLQSHRPRYVAIARIEHRLQCWRCGLESRETTISVTSSCGTLGHVAPSTQSNSVFSVHFELFSE